MTESPRTSVPICLHPPSPVVVTQRLWRLLEYEATVRGVTVQQLVSQALDGFLADARRARREDEASGKVAWGPREPGDLRADEE